MKKSFTLLFTIVSFTIYAQSPATLSSADILLRLKKLKVTGNVLYIAAHPDDENTRLLAYLANEKLYRTGYLSLTRGDGGQNLIGDEQGIELGLIRTQELLAARRIDGAEQFFSRAYDFGFSKHTEEALEKWNEQLILSDVVWVIRNFQPDVIITRFPPDSRAGHGHHSASAVLAREAFTAAADSTKFPEQLKKGVTTWQAKRIFWNTFNFGGQNTQSENQLKINTGGFNTLLGKGYGEIAAESRSQHKSQGFGVPAQRGEAWEYFSFTAGDTATTDLMDDVVTTWAKNGKTTSPVYTKAVQLLDSIINNFSYEYPQKSVAGLVKLYQQIIASGDEIFSPVQKSKKLREITALIEACAGLYFEASTNTPYAVAGDSLRITVNVINRSDVKISATIIHPFNYELSNPLQTNRLLNYSRSIFVPVNADYSQPYWLVKGLNDAHFVVDDQELIGRPENDPAYNIVLSAEIDNQFFVFSKPVQYKYTDPVNGEIYQPLYIVPALSLMQSPEFVFTHLNQQPASPVKLSVTSLSALQKAGAQYYQYEYNSEKRIQNLVYTDSSLSLEKNGTKNYTLNTPDILKKTKEKELRFFAALKAPYKELYQGYTLRKIEYPHIPSITYFYLNKVKVINEEIITAGKKIGYITGAGDKVPEALQAMGYDISFLGEKEIATADLKQYDAIIAGVRAYNVHDWLNNVYDKLMKYIADGGNLVVQYNTSNYIGPVKAQIGPYPFNISRERVTDEKAAVNFIDPNNILLNWPNKISQKDFTDWIQERGIYFADNFPGEYKAVFSMNDPGEKEQKGSLIVADYGKGRFIYTGLVFFRQLPAGIGGAYRLFANIIANPNLKKANGTTKKR
ncbi:MAG: PIG-L family deacetylase [Chitinophagaceae bacterium]|nr:PIG-L family deacetylase [Chitinophagaceae bacterium]